MSGFDSKRNAAADKLQEPAQEPVAWVEIQCPACGDMAISAPPQRTWVGLTDEEIKDIIGLWGDTPIKGYTRKLFNRIDAKLKEKNT